MDIKKLKNMIETATLTDDPIIFKYKNSDFIPVQYYREIAKMKNLNIQVIESLESIDLSMSAWDDLPENLYIWKVDSLKEEISPDYKNLIVITKKVPTGVDCVDVPELEDWQVKGYIATKCKGLKEDQIDLLYRFCKKDIFLLDVELDKLAVFSEKERPIIFDKFVKDGLYDHLSDKNIFDFSNAVISKDFSTLADLYSNIENIDVEPLGLATILYNNFNKLIQVWCTKNPSDYNTSLTNAQIYAIKRQPIKFTYDQLVAAYKLLCSIDYKLKNGYLDNNYIVDYILANLLV